jgi:UDP-glucose 4-epimerase
MKPRAVVTGGAGFIGSELVRTLCSDGWDVTAIDNLVTGCWRNVEGSGLTADRMITGDVTDRTLLDPLLQPGDIVFHLACRNVRFSLHSPVATHEVNASGTVAMLEAARRARAARFVHVSSSEVYGESPHPVLHEESATLPTTAYGASKLAGEAYARAWHRSYGLPVVIVRPFNTYGANAHHAGDAGEAIPRFIRAALAGHALTIFGDGMQSRDFCHVTDTVRGIAAAAACEDVIGATINIGTGVATTILSIAHRIASLAGTDPAIRFDDPRPGDVRRLCAGTDKAAALLGFRSEVAIDEGLSRTFDAVAAAIDPGDRSAPARDTVRNWERAVG